jgi:hypothetical protein
VKGGKMKKIGAVILVLIALAAGGALGYREYQAKAKSQFANKRQAVFLTSGQIYLGFINRVTKQTIELTDVYYIKSTSAGQNNEDQTTNKTTVSVARLGNELYGPGDIVYLNRDQVTYYTNLKEDSKINEAIKAGVK